LVSWEDLVWDIEGLPLIDCPTVNYGLPLATGRIRIKKTDTIVFGKIVMLVINPCVAAITV